MNRNRKIVPALMFHSVGLERHPWAWSYISESLQSFEAKIALLKEKGFTGVSWNDLYDHMAGHRLLPDDSILLTFDDGYLDNWVYVYPVLKRYGMKGTIFVSPDFVDPRADVRANFNDVVAGRCHQDELTVAGFLSWAEMREMEKSGLIDIQSHAMTHTWYFSGPRITDFHRPHEVTPYPWLFWNARPERKPFYLNEDQQGFLPWGYPILEHAKSLTVRRFFPDENAVDAITSMVAGCGGASFFRRADWRSVLESKVSAILNGGPIPGLYESDEVRAERIADELQRSKALIEANLEKEVDFICWPGGANDRFVLDCARAAGYKAWTLSSQSQLGKRNLPGVDPTSIKRIGTSNQLEVRGRRCGKVGPRFLLWKVLDHQGSAAHSAALKARKLVALVSTIGGSR